MDSQPPRPLIPRAARETRRPGLPPPTQQPASPIGSALGCLAAGAWSLVFVHLFQLSGGFFWIVAGLGFVLIALGLVLAGVSINYVLERRHPHG